jgi:hypothetical protein
VALEDIDAVALADRIALEKLVGADDRGEPGGEV